MGQASQKQRYVTCSIGFCLAVPNSILYYWVKVTQRSAGIGHVHTYLTLPCISSITMPFLKAFTKAGNVVAASHGNMTATNSMRLVSHEQLTERIRVGVCRHVKDCARDHFFSGRRDDNNVLRVTRTLLGDVTATYCG